jgi:hypothetical protein
MRLTSGLWLAAILIGALAVGCSKDKPASTPVAETSAVSTAAPEPTATETPQPTATPRPRPEANPFPPDLQTMANGLLQRIVDLRGTPLRQPVDMFLLTRDQARKFYSNQGEPSPTPETQATPVLPSPPPLDPRQEVYELLGLVPKREPQSQQPSVQEQAVDNLISIITGFYDPEFKAFYMIDTINGGVSGPLARSTIVHEFTHALQYQQADLQKIAAERAANADATTALLSVLEGDAVNTEIAILGYSTRSTYRQPVCFTIPAPMRPGTPYVVERELDVWYEDGLCFVQAVAAEGPSGIGGIFDRVPETMEQVLHPEKYLANETGTEITLPDLSGALGPGWTMVGANVFGEFGLQNILLTGLPDDRVSVQEAAAGWGGDAWRLYASGDSRVFHLETRWDTPEDAREFFRTLGRSLFARAGQSNAEPEPPGYSVTIGDATWHVAIDGQRVVVLVGTDEQALATVAPQLGIH